MKNKKLFRTFTVLLAAFVCLGGFSVTAYAGGGEEQTEAPTRSYHRAGNPGAAPNPGGQRDPC